MQRLQRVNMQFAAAGKPKTAKKAAKGNFEDVWSYLGMDEYLGAEAKVIRDKCRAFAERYNPDVSPSLFSH